MSELWTEKYFPKSLDEFIGNSELVKQVTDWAEDWEQGKKGKPLLLFGQTGAGKTCLAYLISQIYGWDIFELNASDLRSEEMINKYAGNAALTASFSGKLRLVLLDEVDGMQRQDKGGISAINSIIKETHNPMLLTANDVYSNRKLLPFRSSCTLLEFKKINYLSIAKRLKEIFLAEKIAFEEEAVKELAKNCGGDFRSALLDAQTLSFSPLISLDAVNSLGYREREEKIFKVMEQIFKGKTFGEIRKARFTSDLSQDLLERWVEENIPRIFVQGNDSANAFDWLSRADIFNGRIMRRQHYGFLRYSSDLSTAGVSLSRENDYHGWLKFQFPSLLSKLSASTSLRNLKKDLSKKIGKQINSSSRKVMSKDIPFLKQVCKDKDQAIALAAQFELDEKEIAFLLDTKPETKKVQSVLGEAAKLRRELFKPKRKALSPLLAEPKLDSESQEKPIEEAKPSEDEKQTSLAKFL